MVRSLLSSVPTVDRSATLADAESTLRTSGAEAVAVVSDGRFVGLILADDLAAARPSLATTLTIGEARGALARVPVTQIMRRDVATIVPETPVTEAARLLRDGGVPLPVVLCNWLMGLVGATELLRALEE